MVALQATGPLTKIYSSNSNNNKFMISKIIGTTYQHLIIPMKVVEAIHEEVVELVRVVINVATIVVVATEIVMIVVVLEVEVDCAECPILQAVVVIEVAAVTTQIQQPNKTVVAEAEEEACTFVTTTIHRIIRMAVVMFTLLAEKKEGAERVMNPAVVVVAVIEVLAVAATAQIVHAAVHHDRYHEVVGLIQPIHI